MSRQVGQQRGRPGDYTGNQQAKLQAELADEQKARQKEMGMATATRVKSISEDVVDYSDGPKLPEVEVVDDLGVEIAEEPIVIIRVNTNIEEMTYGVGTTWNFEEGRKYKVPREIAVHLDNLGYLWH